MKKLTIKPGKKREFNNEFISYSKCSCYWHLIFCFVLLVLAITDLVLVLLSQQYLYLLLLIIPFFGIILSAYNDIKISKYINNKYQIKNDLLTLVRNGEKIEVRNCEIQIDDIMILSKNSEVPAGLIITEGNALVDDSGYSNDLHYKHKTKDDFLDIGTTIIDGTIKCRVVKLADKYQPPFSYKSKGANSFINVMFLSIFTLLIVAALFVLVVTALHDSEAYKSLTSILLPTITGASILLIPYDFQLFSSVKKQLSYSKLQDNNISLTNPASLVNIKDTNVVCFDRLGGVTEDSYDIKEIIPFEGEKVSYIKSIIFRVLSTTGATDPVSKSLLNNVSSVINDKPTSIRSFDANSKYMSATFNDGIFALGNPNNVDISNKTVLLRKLNDYISLGYTVVGVYKASPSYKNINYECMGVVILEEHVKDGFADVVKQIKQDNKEFKIISSSNSTFLKESLKQLGILDAENYISLKGMSDEEVVSIADQYCYFVEATSYQKELIVKSLQSKGQKVMYVGGAINSLFAMNAADYSVALANSHNLVKNASDVVFDSQKASSILELNDTAKEHGNYLAKLMKITLTESAFTLFVFFALLLGSSYLPHEPFNNNVVLYSLFVVKALTLYPVLILMLFNNDQRQIRTRLNVSAAFIVATITLLLISAYPFVLYVINKTYGTYTGINTFVSAFNVSLLSTLFMSLVFGVKNAIPTRKNKYPLLPIACSIVMVGIYVLTIFLLNKYSGTGINVIPDLSKTSGLQYFMVLISVVSGATLLFVVTYIVEIVLGEHDAEEEEEEKK